MQVINSQRLKLNELNGQSPRKSACSMVNCWKKVVKLWPAVAVVTIESLGVTGSVVMLCWGYMWPDLGKRTLTRFSKCTYFKEAYFRNAIRNLNQTWVFYRVGVAATMTWKWSLSTAASRCYGAEFTAFAIEASFSKNGTTTKLRIFGMEGALDF